MLDAVPDPGGPFRFQIKLQFLRNATTSMWIDLLAGTAKEAVMDDHTFLLLRQVDDQIRRIELLIEQHRLHIMSLHPSRRRCEDTKLKSLMSDYARLLDYRRALTTERSYDVMH
jgi:hypothetical protein